MRVSEKIEKLAELLLPHIEPLPRGPWTISREASYTGGPFNCYIRSGEARNGYGIRINRGSGWEVDVTAYADRLDNRDARVDRVRDHLRFDSRLALETMFDKVIASGIVERFHATIIDVEAQLADRNAKYADEYANAGALVDAFPTAYKRYERSGEITVPLPNGLVLPVVPTPTGFTTNLIGATLTLTQIKAITAGLGAIAL